jgi:hypothetical protein
MLGVWSRDVTCKGSGRDKVESEAEGMLLEHNTLNELPQQLTHRVCICYNSLGECRGQARLCPHSGFERASSACTWGKTYTTCYVRKTARYSDTAGWKIWLTMRC